MNLFQGIALLLVFQLIGESLSMVLGLPLPGPVLGMILLFLLLLKLRRVPTSLEFTSDQLLANLSLFFVPAGVGVITHLQRIGSEWFPIVTTLFVSTFVSLAVTAIVMQLTLRLMKRGGHK